MNANDFPSMIAQRVTLRQFVPEDARKIYLLSQESGLRTWLPDQVYDSEEQALKVLLYLIETLRDPGNPALGPYVLGVHFNESNELIGHVGLSPLHGQVEIGYAIEDKHQGKGLATQVVRAMSDSALTRFELPRVLGIVASDNAASCRVLVRAGFVLVEESMGSLHGLERRIRRYEKTRPSAIAWLPGDGG